jgi:hypothetical protein
VSVHAAPRLRCIAEDALLVVMPMLALAASSKWMWLLAASGLVVLAFNAITLHFPREIAIDETGIRFRAYGREHAYAWASCRVKVRRFVVRDRLLVRIEDERGRRHNYWLLSRLRDFDALTSEISSRAVSSSSASPASS